MTWSRDLAKAPQVREILVYDPMIGVTVAMWSPLRGHWVGPTPGYVGMRGVNPVMWQEKPAEPEAGQAAA